MGLFDFFKKGEEKPAANPAKPAGSTPDFLKTGQPGTPTSTPAPTAGDKYTVKSGDSLSKIAKSHYGDAMKWNKIYEANKALIGDNPDMIHPGQELILPKL